MDFFKLCPRAQVSITFFVNIPPRAGRYMLQMPNLKIRLENKFLDKALVGGSPN